MKYEFTFPVRVKANSYAEALDIANRIEEAIGTVVPNWHESSRMDAEGLGDDQIDAPDAAMFTRSDGGLDDESRSAMAMYYACETLEWLRLAPEDPARADSEYSNEGLDDLEAQLQQLQLAGAHAALAAEIRATADQLPDDRKHLRTRLLALLAA